MNSMMEKGFAALTMTTVDIADVHKPKGIGETTGEDVLRVNTGASDSSKVQENVPSITIQPADEAGKDRSTSKSKKGSESVIKSSDVNKDVKKELRLIATHVKVGSLDSNDGDEGDNIGEKSKVGDEASKSQKTDSSGKSPKKDGQTISEITSPKKDELQSRVSSAKSQLSSPSRDPSERTPSANAKRLAIDVAKIATACERANWRDAESLLKKLQKDITEGKYTDFKPLTQTVDQEFGWTPLMHAVRDGKLPVAEMLIHLGCDVHARNKEGHAPVHIAALYGQVEMFSFLVERGADATVLTEPKNENVLHLACSKKHENHGTLIKTLTNSLSANSRLHPDKSGLIPLHVAINSGSREACQELLTKLAPDQINYHCGIIKDTALHLSVRTKNYDIAWILMDSGAYVNSTNGDEQTALHIASEAGDERFVKWFYLYRAKVTMIDKFGNSPTVLAVTKGHKEILDILVDKFKASVFERTRDGSTLVHIASLHGHPETAMSLYERGVPLQMPNKGGARSLHIAARHGHSEMVRRLLQKGEDVDATTHDNYTSLHIAVEYGKPQVVETLLGHGAQLHIKGGKVGETALHIAGRTEDGENCVLMLLKSGADPLLTMENGETALHVAARHGKVLAVKLLLREGANPAHRSKEGFTALHLACINGHLEVIKELLHYVRKDRGEEEIVLYCNMVTLKGESALHFTAGLPRNAKVIKLAAATLPTLGKVAFPSLNRNKDISGLGKEIAKLLLKNGASVLLQTRDNKETSFHYCAREGNNDILKEMLNTMTPPQILRTINKQSINGWSPLLTACKSGHVDTVKTLLDAGARVDIFDTEGQSGLHLAAEAGNREICDILMKHNAFINAKSRVGLSVLHLAAKNGFHELCYFLIQEHGAIVDIVTLKKQTPLHLAAEAGRLQVCRLLMALRANSDAVNEQGQKPIHLAAANNHSDVIELFLKMNSALASSSTKDGSSCAHLAANQGSMSVLEELMKFDKEGVISARNRSTDATALQIAAEGGHADLVKSLLDAGANPTDENKEGYAAVHLAAKNGHTTVIYAMRNSQGLSLCSKKLGLTGLHIAAFFGQQAAVRELLQYIPATITSEPPLSEKSSFIKELGTEYGLTPLHMASYSGEEGIVRVLLNISGVQVDAPTVCFGFNPLHLASRGGHDVVVGLLLSRSAELLESRDANGKTSLHISAVHGHVQMCEVLLGQGAEIDSLDRDMWTPLHCAAQQGHLEVVRLLIESGASPLAKTNKGYPPIWFASTEQHVPVLNYLMEREHDTYSLMEDHDFVFYLTICGKKTNNEPLTEFVLVSPAPVEVAGKLSNTLLVVSGKEKEREKELIAAAQQIEGMAAELLVLSASAESAGKVLLAVDRKGIRLLDVLIENEQKEVVAHSVVQNYLKEVWHGNLEWASWKLLLLFLFFIIIPPIWIIFSLPLGHKYYKIPIIKFMSYLTSHIHLMILLCLISVTPISPVIPIRTDLFPFWFEWVFLVWILGLIVSEVMDPSDKGGLGWIKVTVLVFSLLGVVGHGIGFLIDKSSYGILLYIRNQMFGCAVLLATVQILDFLSFHYLFGPWAIIIGNLMKDLARFLAVLLIFMLGFCLMMSALNSPVHMRDESVPLPTNRTLTNGLPSGVLVTPIDAFEQLFFALFGQTEPEDMKIETGQPEWTLILFKLFFAIFMLVTVVVLINLLIAMMSDTYQRIQAQSDIEWKYGLAKLIVNYHRTVATPSPINIFTIWIIWIYNKCNTMKVARKDKKREKKVTPIVPKAKVVKNKFAEMTPKQRWQDLYKRVKERNPNRGSIGMTFNIAQVTSMLKESRMSIGDQDRIENVTEWPVIANKYRNLIGLHKAPPKESPAA